MTMVLYCTYRTYIGCSVCEIILCLPLPRAYTRPMSTDTLAPVVTYVLADDATGDSCLWRVEDGRVQECTPVLRESETDPGVWLVAVTGLTF